MPQLTDSYGRIHNYLRVSITNRCNLGCIYCRKADRPDAAPFSSRPPLDTDGLLRILSAAAELGIAKIRLTGGEPLLREDLVALVKAIRAIPGITDLALTTNGILLAAKAEELRRAGLDRVNVSLDSLDPAGYAAITRGGDLNAALDGIAAAIAAGLTPLKINAVFLKGINDHQLPQFLEFARNHPVMIRFIEYMPLGAAEAERQGRFRSLDALPEIDVLVAQGTLSGPTPSANGNAESYAISGGLGTLALIRPISHHFCAACNRLRLTADGFLKPCLAWPEELDLKPYLNDPAGLRDAFRRAVTRKHREHQMDRAEFSAGKRRMSDIGG